MSVMQPVRSDYAQDPNRYAEKAHIHRLEIELARIMSEIEKLNDPHDERLGDVKLFLEEARKRLGGYRLDEPRRSFKAEWPDEVRPAA